MKSTEENIRKYGWEAIYVFDQDGERQPFSYSIGLEESYDHPEVLIFGLKRKTMHNILSDVASDVKNGNVYKSNEKISGLVSGDFEVEFREVRQECFSKYLGAACRYYEKPFRAQVMFWPDKNNILPLENGCEVDNQNEALQIIE